MGNDLMSAAGLIHIIEESRQNALKKVNEELIKMYWKVGEFLSKETEHASYGDAYIDEISREIQETFGIVNGTKKPWRNEEGFVIMGMKYFLLNVDSLEF